jgi:transcriptional regulator with XRE-family HTH domain
MKLSEALRAKQGDQSLRSVARQLGVAVGTAEGWLKGWRTPDLKHIPKIAKFLGVEVAGVFFMALEEAEANSAKGVYLSSFSHSLPQPVAA